LQYSKVVPGVPLLETMLGGTDAGSSVLLSLLTKLALGNVVKEGHKIILHPLAFAGWLGLFITALNLLPIGQLDGGHIAHALFGRRNSDTIGMVALFSLFLLGLFVWSGLLTWAIIVFFIAGAKSAPPLNDISKLDPRRVAIGAFTFILLFLILIPVPHAFYQSLGIHCPYI
ncbi:MAG: site-2 protease family protein, partial [Nitrospira sp.]|nr:site-2 protease family protein [Nitrospira sp.]